MSDMPSDTAPRTLKRWKSHKVVEAEKIASITVCGMQGGEHGGWMLSFVDDNSPFWVSDDYFAKHNPQPGGYFVRYADGYESFSPAKAFEEGYLPA